MTETPTRIIAFVVLAIYVVVCAAWKRPRTYAGGLAFKLSLVNVASWAIVLPLDNTGHPPPQVIVGGLLWLLNLPLLVAIISALWVALKSRQEDFTYLIVAIAYVFLNVTLLLIVPAILLLSLR